LTSGFVGAASSRDPALISRLEAAPTSFRLLMVMLVAFDGMETPFMASSDIVYIACIRKTKVA
jgi:hypothetical protein